MELFIVLILVCAFLQSMVKLSLLPRIYCWGVLALLIPLPFVLHGRLVGLNLQAVDAWLYSGSVLQNLCVIVIVQEILALVVGVTLLTDVELERPLKYWKFLSLMPSVLVPLGLVFIQVSAFNHLVRYDFSKITWAIAIGAFLFSVGVNELIKLLFRTRIQQMATALNTDWLLVLLAIFLPIALSNNIMGHVQESYNYWQDMWILAAFTGAVVLFGVIFHLVRAIRNRKYNRI